MVGLPNFCGETSEPTPIVSEIWLSFGQGLRCSVSPSRNEDMEYFASPGILNIRCTTQFGRPQGEGQL